MLTIKNNNRTNTPNILHFQGDTGQQLTQTFDCIYERVEVPSEYDRENITLISCWTDEEKCCLLKQCKKSSIKLVNAIPKDYDTSQQWDMRNKIKFILDTLKTVKTKYSIILDGYDVLLVSLTDIIEKFESQPYSILFNATCNNFPDVYIDCVPQRYKCGTHAYFNAGCCIGYTDKLIKFYSETNDIATNGNLYNPYCSEQFILRHTFANYSKYIDQKFVFFDWESKIFQTMGKVNSSAFAIGGDMNNLEILFENLDLNKKTIIVTGSDGFIGKRLSEYLLSNNDYNVVLIDRQHDFEVDDINGIFLTKKVELVYHLAAQTSVWNDNIEQIKRDNIDSFIKVANLCNRFGVKLVYASSSTANITNTTSMYGITKRFAEDYAKIYCPCATGVRLHNIYGPNPRNGTLLWHCLNDEELVLYNNGENKRTFTYIDDAVVALLKASKSNEKLVNCCSEKNICTVKEFVHKVKQYKKIKVKYISDKRYLDNEEQKVDYNIPNIMEEYLTIDEGLKNIFTIEKPVLK